MEIAMTMTRRWWTVTLLCGLHLPLSLTTVCPAACRCQDIVMDCSHSRLSSFPATLPQTSFQFNFSSNRLTSLDDLHSLPHSLASLDLSFNQIARIPPNIFGGRQFLDLLALNLSDNRISDDSFVLPSSLQVLRLNGNKLAQFCVERFRHVPDLKVLALELNGLESLNCGEDRRKESGEKAKNEQEQCPFQPLQELSEVLLRGNKLKTLKAPAFWCFRNAVFLSLADNLLRSLPAQLLKAYHRLKYLDLSGNFLSSVPKAVFWHLSSLRFLSVARNRLRKVPAALPMLEWLDLSHNAITAIPESQKNDLYPQEVFLIGGNPLHCDCELLWLKELFDTREYLIQYLDVQLDAFMPACASPPNLRGESWDVLGDTAFGCKPKWVRDPETSGKTDFGAVHLEDLSFRVREIGSTYLRLQWDSLDSGQAEPNKEPRKVFISFHPFGHRTERKTKAVQASVGVHRIRNLRPDTAYIVCIALSDASNQNAASKEDCVEVVTKGDEHFRFFDMFMRIGVVVMSFFVLTVWCRCTSNVTKDIPSRRKTD